MLGVAAIRSETDKVETGRLKTDPAEEDLRDFPLLAQALAYWRGKRCGEDPPRRLDLDPAEVPALLPYVNLVDVVEGEGGRRFRHRLEGTGLVKRFKRDSTGQWFDENYAPAHWRAQRPAYEGAVATRLPNLNTVAVRSLERASLCYGRLIAPLAEPDGAVAMLFVVFEFQDFDGADAGLGLGRLPIHR